MPAPVSSARRLRRGPRSLTLLSGALSVLGVGLAGSLLPVAPACAADTDTIRGAAGEREDQPSGALWLRLRGVYARDDDVRERVLGVLELGLGLDRWMGGETHALASSARDERRLERSVPLASTRSPEGALESAPAAPTASDPCRTPGGCAEAPGPRGSADVPERARSLARTRSTGGLEVTPALARAALAAALRADPGTPAEERLESLAARSRSSASLPELRFAAGTSRDEALRLAPTLNDPARYTQDGGRDLWFETRLTWHLDRVLFSHDEIAIERLRAQAREARRHTTHQVLDALLEWQRARRVARSEIVGDDERDAAMLHELEATLRLDALTGGWFSRQLAHSSDAAAASNLTPAAPP